MNQTDDGSHNAGRREGWRYVKYMHIGNVRSLSASATREAVLIQKNPPA